MSAVYAGPGAVVATRRDGWWMVITAEPQRCPLCGRDAAMRAGPVLLLDRPGMLCVAQCAPRDQEEVTP